MIRDEFTHDGERVEVPWLCVKHYGVVAYIEPTSVDIVAGCVLDTNDLSR